MAATINKEIQENKANLLLSSPKYFDQLLDNCIHVGIKKCYDGIKLMADGINNYFKGNYDCQKIIAIQMSGFAKPQKHLGGIMDILKSRGLQVVYIVSHEHDWFEQIVEDFHKNGQIYIAADCEFLENLNFFPFVIEQTNIIKFHTGISSLKIVTSMEQISNPICSKKGMLDVLNYAFLGASYLNVHSQTLFGILQKKQTCEDVLPDTSSTRFIKGGYPSIEQEIKNFGSVDYEIKRDTVIFISCFLNFEMPDKLYCVMSKVLQAGYRVLFKSCPPLGKFKEKEENDFASKFSDYDNFVYWNNLQPRLSAKELHRSICAIEIYSSMMYSYPVITKRPAILLYPNMDSVKCIDDSFYNANLHIRMFDNEMPNLLSVIHRLSNDLEYQKEWEDKIMNYCINDLFNYCCASEYLADWIINWYQKRALIQNSYLF